MLRNKKALVVIAILLVVVLVAFVVIPKVVKTIQENKKEELRTLVMQSKFDKYYDEDRFVNMKFLDVLRAFVEHNPGKYDYNSDCNEDCTGYDQIEAKYDTENYDYVCVYLQTKTYGMVDHAIIIYFSVNKNTNEVKPFAIATEDNNFRLEYVNEPSRVIGLAYTYIELLIKYS